MGRVSAVPEPDLVLISWSRNPLVAGSRVESLPLVSLAMLLLAELI